MVVVQNKHNNLMGLMMMYSVLEIVYDYNMMSMHFGMVVFSMMIVMSNTVQQ